jgi:hypothetical protein
MTKIPVPDVVVLLPGITGSVLAKDGKAVWEPSAGAVLRALVSFGKSVKNLEVADDDWQRANLGDGVTASKLVSDVHLIPGLWKIDGYTTIENFLLQTFDLTENENYFPFPYDWRRDNRASAKQLRARSAEWLKKWRQQSGNQRAKLVLIGHSMGGLVARYFVECLSGWEDTRAVISFGSPFYGSINAIDFLLNGLEKKVGFLGLDLTDMVRSFRSVHQLVPTYRCVYSGGTTVTPAAAKLPGWKSEWDVALCSFNQEVEAAAAQNRADPRFLAAPPVYRPIVGTDQPTRQSVNLTGGNVCIAWDRDGVDEAGDGTVPLLSAALSGTEDQRTFAPEQHGRLQNYNAMLAHLKGVLTSLYQVRIDDLRTDSNAWFSYKADQLFLTGEPVVVELATRSSIDESLLPSVSAVVTVENRSSGPVLQRRIQVPRIPTRFEIGELPPGTYTLAVQGSTSSSTAPVSDVFIVADPHELE